MQQPMFWGLVFEFGIYSAVGVATLIGGPAFISARRLRAAAGAPGHFPVAGVGGHPVRQDRAVRSVYAAPGTF